MVLQLPKDTMDIWEVLDNEIQRPRLPRRTSIHTYPSEASIPIKDPVTGNDAVSGGCLRSSWFRFWNQAADLCGDNSEEDGPKIKTWDTKPARLHCGLRVLSG